MMSEEPVAKKCRVWNPALDDDSPKSQKEHGAPIETRGSNGLPFPAPPFMHPHNLPFFINNYVQLAAPLLAQFQQQQQLHAAGAVQKAFFDQLAAARNMKSSMLPPPHMFHHHHPIPQPPMQPVPPHHQQQPLPPMSSSGTEVPTTSGRSANPIVLSTIGGSSMPINQNCCAVCGASFRLTGDLVQHMRSNHRNSKYRRRNQPTTTQ